MRTVTIMAKASSAAQGPKVVAIGRAWPRGGAREGIGRSQRGTRKVGSFIVARSEKMSRQGENGGIEIGKKDEKRGFKHAGWLR